MLRYLMCCMVMMMVGCGQVVEQKAEVQGTRVALGERLPDFELTTFEGDSHRLSDLMDGQHFTVVVFHSPTCPCARSCARAIAAEFTAQAYPDVRFLGVLPDPNWDVDWMRTDLEAQQREGIVSFPVVIDRDQSVMNAWGVERVPTVFLADKQGRLRYFGAPESTLEPDLEGYEFLLKDAVDALRAGLEPEVTSFMTIGCRVGRRQEESTTGD